MSPKLEIKIEYNGKYPTLCYGKLDVWVEGELFEFGVGILSSGGSVSFDEDWDETVTEGPWTITKWPNHFPCNRKQVVLDAINKQIPWGCCGGCV